MDLYNLFAASTVLMPLQFLLLLSALTQQPFPGTGTGKVKRREGSAITPTSFHDNSADFVFCPAQIDFNIPLVPAVPV